MRITLRGIVAIPFGALAIQGCGGDPNGVDLPSPAVPEALDDGWPVASLDDVGIDPDPISLLAEEARAGDLRGKIEGLLIVRNGKLVFEEYFDSRYGVEEFHVLNSATKSVASLVVGAAVRQGLFTGPDQPIPELFPEHGDLFSADPRKGAILLRHVLTMTAGLAWDQKDPSNQDRDGIHIMRASDASRYVLEKPLVSEPGERFLYSGGCSALLSAAVRNVSGIQADAFAAQHLFGPLGIHEWDWRHWDDGIADSDGGLAMRGRDVAKLGQLVLQRGEWEGQQVVPESWVSASAHPWTTTHEHEARYGFQWWLYRLPTEDGSGSYGDIIVASGFGGNKLIAIPSLELVVVFFGCSGTYDCGNADTAPQVALYNYLLKAVD